MPTRRDRGAADVLGVVLLAPAVIGLALLVIFLGRQVDAQAQVRTAAESGAQAAALSRSAPAAADAARRAAAAMLTDADTCTSPRIDVDVSGFAPGGSVAVTVICTVSRRGVEPVTASTRTVRSTATATIDPFRAVTP